MQSVGVLGLGIIGAIWARNWHADGCLSAVWNRTAYPDFPCWVNSPAAVAEVSDILVICVSDTAAVQSVIDAMKPVLSHRHTVVQSSTIDPASSIEFERQVIACGARYVAAPFTGSKPAAEARKTVYYLGGETADIERVLPALKKISGEQFCIGTNAHACTLKLAMNLQIAIIAGGLCESLAFARQAGISDEIYFKAMRKNVSWGGLSELKEGKLRAENYDPQFSIKHLRKDTGFALKSMYSLNMPLLETVYQCLNAVESKGFGDEDFIALYRNTQS
jgi:3-hydroxyisobutyrate dehydrogenase-like beta-hydroxyacid dehydrogenase